MNCLQIREQVDVTEGIQKQVTILWCKNCGRYLQVPRRLGRQGRWAAAALLWQAQDAGCCACLFCRSMAGAGLHASPAAVSGWQRTVHQR